MANLILPRALSVDVAYDIFNYFMETPDAVELPAATAVDIGPGQASYTWLDNTGAAVTEFAVDVSTPPAGTVYAYQLVVDGQLQADGLVTAATNEVLELTSDTLATIPAASRIVFTIFQVVTTTQ